VLRGTFCKRAKDHLLGLDEVYLHFVWGVCGFAQDAIIHNSTSIHKLL